MLSWPVVEMHSEEENMEKKSNAQADGAAIYLYTAHSAIPQNEVNR